MRFSRLQRMMATLAVCLALAACSPDSAPKTKKFVIVDQRTGNTVSTYEYQEGDTRPSMIHSYGADRQLKASYSLEYDAQERLRAASVVETSARGIPRSRSVSYSYQDTVGPDGKLLTSTQSSTTGETVVTHYGYDEAGTLRGVVQESASGLLMKDYPQ